MTTSDQVSSGRKEAAVQDSAGAPRDRAGAPAARLVLLPMSGVPGAGPGGAGGPWVTRRAHRSYVEVTAAPGAVPYARRCTRQALALWELGQVAGDAELVVSELVTNAVRAMARKQRTVPVALYLADDPGRLTLLVWDACSELPVHRPHGDASAGGRGLDIVQALSDRWGTQAPVRGGKVVWAWFDLDRP
jgi:serine/threonine-protein kinase RsbW